MIAIAWAAAAATAGAATGSVQLELVGDASGLAMAFQEWAQVLARAGIRNVRVRSATDVPKPGIDVQGSKERPLYVVTGIVQSRDELLLPGARFRRSEVGRLAQWLNELAEEGPPGQREGKGAFGLPVSRLRQIQEELAAPVGFSTRGMTREQVVEKIIEQLKSPVKIDAAAAARLPGGTVDEELTELACGAALAYVLRLSGNCLTVRRSGQTISLAATPVGPDVEAWPIGLSGEEERRELLPALFELHNVNVQNVSAATALGAIARLLKVPVLMDRKAMARHGIDPAKAMVSLPQSRTSYSLALRKLLFEAKLKFELRYDEAKKPFLWVTTIKPA
jgi:hypothetical protein